jgi:hypothetical protein
MEPKKSKFPDFNSWALKTRNDIFPKLLVNTASAEMRVLMKLKDGELTDGNVLRPSGYPHRIYGEKLLPVPSKRTKLVMGLGVSAAVALILVGRRR